MKQDGNGRGGKHDARHEAAHVVAALHYKLPVAYATLTHNGGACRLGSNHATYQEELEYVIEHAEDYAVIYMAGTAYERLAGIAPARIAMLTEADRACAKEYLQKKHNDYDKYSENIANILEDAVEKATQILADNFDLWNAIADALDERHNLRWEDIKQIALKINP
jgi:ATP-dependent Zn protease